MWKNVSLILFVLVLALSFSACSPFQEPGGPDGPAAQPTEDPGEISDQGSPLLTASGDSQQVVIHWQRSGGFAGICQEMDVFADGHAVLMDCGSSRLLASGDISTENRMALKNWLESYQEFNWTFKPPKGSADMFLDEFTFSGIGDQVPGERAQEDINQELAKLAQSLLQQPSDQ